MKKILFCLSIILVIGSMVCGGDGPSDLEKGMSLEEITAVLGEAPCPHAKIGDKTLLYGYSVCSARKLPEFELFILTITPFKCQFINHF